MGTSNNKLQICTFLGLWLGFALGSLAMPVESLSPWLIKLLSALLLFGYILMAGSLSYLIIIASLDKNKDATTALLVSALSLLLLYFFHNKFNGHHFFAVMQTLTLLILATISGTLLSTAITRIGELVPLALTAAAADVTSVFFGPTKEMGEQLTNYYGGGMEGSVPLVDLFLFKAVGPGGLIQPLFGVSDWILIALFAAAMVRLGSSDNLFRVISFQRRQNGQGALFFSPGSAGLFTSLLVAGLFQLYVPALFFICLFFLLFLFLHCKIWRKLTRKDIRYSLLFPAVIGILIIIFAR